jgi:hypothetical protein
MNKYIDEFYQEERIKNQSYYHGTSDVFNIPFRIYPPEATGVIREDFRVGNRDVVYVTPSYDLAYKYALKAVDKFGGNPIVYEVIPNYETLAHRMDYEYTTAYADIKNRPTRR